MNLSNIDVTALIIIIAAVWFVVQSISATKLPSKFLPLVSIVVGIIISLAYSYLSTKNIQLEQDLFFGIFAGFSASGLDDTLTKSVSGLINNFVGVLISKATDSTSTDSSSTDTTTVK
ncbi:holin [Oenococcus oeni]|uniref:holin n=1 Tax=Oenococcus oeni TaxID=1247 RepID=UPI00050D96A7|nr:holin [Oenococcus oeni]KGH55212.1 holin [Oenococcus oeni S22]OIL71226.1 holin [Oenococcus oeni]OIM06394.1 holin [Oenococcus oeni]PDH92618.1 holin [Oenococcus oeni]PDH93212.1 holin [Oenococcus oeni]